MSRLFSVIITLAGMTVLLSFTSPAQAASLSILKGAYSFGTKNIFYATAYAQNFRKRPWDIEPAA